MPDPPPSITATPLLNPRNLPPRAFFEQYGYVLIPGTPTSRRLASTVLRLRLREAPYATLDGPARQYDITPGTPAAVAAASAEELQELLARWEAELRSLISVHLACPQEQQGKTLLAPKVLVTQPGEGEQEVHWGQHT